MMWNVIHHVQSRRYHVYKKKKKKKKKKEKESIFKMNKVGMSAAGYYISSLLPRTGYTYISSFWKVLDQEKGPIPQSEHPLLLFRPSFVWRLPKGELANSAGPDQTLQGLHCLKRV